jgi:hypothetical protein
MFFGLAEVLNPPKTGSAKRKIRKSLKKLRAANCKSENCHIYGRSANLTNLIRRGKSLQICDLRKLFEDSPPLKMEYLSAERRGDNLFTCTLSKNKSNMHVIYTNGRTFCYLQGILCIFIFKNEE